MRILTFIQILFLTILGLFVAARSTERLENSWDSAKIQQIWEKYSDEADFAVLFNTELDLLDEAFDRLINQLESWRIRWQNSHNNAKAININELRKTLSSNGAYHLNQALGSSIRKGMLRIRKVTDQNNDEYRNLEEYYDLYNQVQDIINAEEIPCHKYDQMLNSFHERKSIISRELYFGPSL
jgi:hypothetical protein